MINLRTLLRNGYRVIRWATGHAVKHRRNLLESYGDRPLRDLFEDRTPVSIYDRSLRWIGLPDRRFIDYVTNRPRLPFDGVPPDPRLYSIEPTFMIAQMHRLWLTTSVVRRFLSNRHVVLDLGAFPFSLDIILREYVRFKGQIRATVNLPLRDEWKRELERRRIDVSYVNLDPYVRPDDQSGRLPTELEWRDASIDVVLFTHVIEHLYHPMSILREAYRVLKPGGRLLLSSDNAFMIDTLRKLCRQDDFLHEPVQGTSAMAMHFWRGHNRFFSARDMTAMLEGVGFTIAETHFFEVCYNAFSDRFFREPVVALPRWKADILTRIPEYRNEIIIVARK